MFQTHLSNLFHHKSWLLTSSLVTSAHFFFAFDSMRYITLICLLFSMLSIPYVTSQLMRCFPTYRARLKVVPRFCEYRRQVEAEVISRRSNKIHQTLAELCTSHFLFHPLWKIPLFQGSPILQQAGGRACVSRSTCASSRDQSLRSLYAQLGL